MKYKTSNGYVIRNVKKKNNEICKWMLVSRKFEIKEKNS